MEVAEGSCCCGMAVWVANCVSCAVIFWLISRTLIDHVAASDLCTIEIQALTTCAACCGLKVHRVIFFSTGNAADVSVHVWLPGLMFISHSSRF